MSDEFDRLVPEFLALARRIFDAGGKAERDRLVSIIQTPNAVGVSRRLSPTRELTPRRGAAAYGVVSLAVKNALTELMPTAPPEGIGGNEVAEVCRRHGKSLTEAQVRAALKGLARHGDAIRVARGRFLLNPDSGEGEEPGAAAPDPINRLESMAAE